MEEEEEEKEEDPKEEGVDPGRRSRPCPGGHGGGPNWRP